LALFLIALAIPSFAQNNDGKITPRLERVVAEQVRAMQQDDGSWGIWVYFTDKNLTAADLNAALASAESALPERTLQRRAKVAQPGARLVDGTDLPVADAYLTAVAATGAQPRRQSRWINAASFNATEDQIEAIANLPFVTKVDLVARFIRPEMPVSEADQAAAEQAIERAKSAAEDRWTLSYGGSTSGLEQINVPPVHEMGLTGSGIIIGMLDAGFHTTHVALQDVDVLDQWDFVNDDGNVGEEPGDPDYQARHGTQTLSTIMGFKNGELVGPAYGASVILAMTEDTGDETPIEEDNWVAGIEWVESLGADVVSSSLGYYYWYEFSDMDGNTAVTTVAADMAVGRGIFVVTSAGNERGNESWPHMTAPADGDSVVAVGAVDSDGYIASFSSPGPTYDGRIKPDVSARGVSSYVASYYDDNSYHTADGTSFACPLTAGVGVLLLERVPSLTPMQVREALRETAHLAANPDNDYGWGIIDAQAAASYWGATIDHQPLADTEDAVGPYAVTATITDRNPLDPGAMDLFWRVDGGPWNQVALASSGGDEFSADIPGATSGGFVEYYLKVTDSIDITISSPLKAPLATHSFTVGIDSTLPILAHANLIDQPVALWPPVIIASAEDNVGVDRIELTFSLNGGGQQGPYEMVPVDDHYELEFPLSSGSVQIGDGIDYELTAWDTAGVPNSAVSGPHTFFVVENLGHVLLIKEQATAPADAGDDAAKGALDDIEFETTSAGEIAQWLVDAGYLVDTIEGSDVSPGAFDGYDALVLSCGNNPACLSSPILREELIAWSQARGRILLEGGDIGDVVYTHNYLDFAQYVMHTSQWWGDLIEGMTMLQADSHDQHFMLNRPHVLPEQLIVHPADQGYDFTAIDLMYAAEDALPILRAVYNPNTGGVLIHDDNTGPEAGQIVYFTFDMDYMDEADGRILTENAMAYLLGREAPGNGSISGTVTLAESQDASGVLVDAGFGHTAMTAADGTYSIEGLHGASYTLVASREGYGPVTRQVVLAADEVATGIDFNLEPIIEINLAAYPDVDIPDNNPEGVTSVITVTEDAYLFDINIDIDISHPSIGHLIVTLTSPEGTEVVLHNHTGGIFDDIIGNWDGTLSVDGPGALSDFKGESVTGDWTLHVADTQFAAWGHFNSWGLNILATTRDISAAPENLPTFTRMTGNAPNPFNPMTTISFELAVPGKVQLDVFDVRGRLVRRLMEDHLEAGRHDIVWNGRDDGRRDVASGVYFVRMNAASTQHLHKMMLVR